MLPAILLLLFSLSGLSFGESVFLKDGNILEGKISKENDKKITITLSTDEVKEIDRKDIIRTVYHSNYKDKRYLTKMDGTVIEVYIVDEDKTGYIYRLKLDSADEVRIAKDDVDGISKRKVTIPVAREETREEKLVTRAPRIRFGLTMAGPIDPVTDYVKNNIGPYNGALLDLFLYRMRDANGNGFDLFARCVANDYDTRNNFDLGLGYETPPPGTDYTWDYTEIAQIGFGGGIRYNRGIYLAGFLWQGYLMAYYQYSIIDVEASYNYTNGVPGPGCEVEYNYRSHGIVGGAGIELGIFTNLGIFGEYTYGYSKVPFPAGDKNFEGDSIRFGVSIRTSYL